MPKIKALFLAANPRSTKRLAIDEEMHAIEQKLRAADYRDALVFQSAWAVRPDDLLQLLNQHQPHIVHFSGHGNGKGLILAGGDGQYRLVTTPALKMLFTTLKGNIRLVVLNACYSREQAQALVEIIDCVIGMEESISDDAATAFASSFYRAIGFGHSIREAFDQGLTSLLLEGIAGEDIPELLVKEGVDANQIILVGGRKSREDGGQRYFEDGGQRYFKGEKRSSRFGAPFPEIWNVSRRHNTFFTGRDHLLRQLYNGFTLESETAIVPPQALTGLGGIGKTQTAAEYAYRFRNDYHAVLWVSAESQEDLVASFRAIASLLKRPKEYLQDRESLISSMQEWFITNTGWLLILDNADDLALANPFLPKAARGHILLTTRAKAVGALAKPFVLNPLDPEDGALCILRRAGYLTWDKQLCDVSSPSVVSAAQTLSRLMDGLPLALEQAGAYIEETGCGVSRYLEIYQPYRHQIWSLHPGSAPDYPKSVASAWAVSRSIVKENTPAAYELLQLCAFLVADAIPDEIFTKGAAALGEVLGPVAADPLALNSAISVLLHYSLLNREVDRETDLPRLSIHRTMQELLRDEMDSTTKRCWAEQAVRAVFQALPAMDQQIMRAYVRSCIQLISQWNMTFHEAEQLQFYMEELHDTD